MKISSNNISPVSFGLLYNNLSVTDSEELLSDIKVPDSSNMNVAYSELDVTVLTSLSNLIGVGNPKSSVVPSKIILNPASEPVLSVPSKRMTPPSCAVTTVSGVFCNNLNPASVCDESVPSNNNSPSFSKIISSGS